MDVQITPVFRYWDTEPHKITGMLQDLRQSGITTVGAWIPWAHLESDRKHRLQKFVRQALQFDFKIRLSVTPEISIGFPNGGVPEDLLLKPENLAQDRTGQNIYSFSPPNIHPLANLTAPQVFQRFGHFLLRLSQELIEVLDDDFQAQIDLMVGDTFFKHYSTVGLPLEDHGDFSFLYFQRELDAIRGWSVTQAERTFRARAMDFLSTRFERYSEVNIQCRNIFTRSSSLDRLISELSGASVCVGNLFQKMTEARPRCDSVWLDDLRRLPPKQRNFLISSALTLYGDLWLPVEEILETSATFRKKMALISDSMSGPNTHFYRPVLAMVQNRFAPALFSKVFYERMGSSLQMSGYLQDLDNESIAQIKLMIVEEALAIEYSHFTDLIQQAKDRNITIAFFRSSLCKRAQGDISCLKTFRIRHGWNYEVAIFESRGHIIVIDGQENSLTKMKTLMERLLAVAGISEWCEQRQPEISSISVNLDHDQKSRILFLLNPSNSVVDTSIYFREGAKIEGIHLQKKEEGTETPSMQGEEFETKLPPYSVVPVALSMPEEVDIEKYTPIKENEPNRKEQNGTSPQLA